MSILVFEEETETRGIFDSQNNNLIATSSILYDSNSLENNNACELTKKIEFAESLVSDIDRLISMGEMLTDEQEANHEINLVSFDVVDLVYFPLKQLIELTIMRLNNKFDSMKLYELTNPNQMLLFL